VLLVLAAHVRGTAGFPSSPRLRSWMLDGVIGVDLFFVISGFLITALMLREIAGTGQIDVRAFYFRRVLRIIPAYACFLVVLLALHACGWVAVHARDWVGTITYTVNFLDRPAWEVGHLWSLSVEEHFYLLWPITLALAGVARATRVCRVLIAACLLARTVVVAVRPRCMPIIEFWTPIRIDTIAFGCLLALLAHDATLRRKLDHCARSSVLVCATLALLGVSVHYFSRSARYQAGAYTVNGAMIAFLTWATIRRAESVPGALLNHHWIVAVGTGSYSLYLWQQIFLSPGRHGWVHRFPQNLILAGAAACLSYWFIERPFLTLKHRRASAPRPSPSSGLKLLQLPAVPNA
jgi:peptidoglycan/LPS O-acetylase OafA/YrhL